MNAAPASRIEPVPLTALHGIGEALAGRLRQFGVHSVTDLLFVLPLRYEDRTRIQPIGALLAGQRAQVEGEVLLAEISHRGRRQLLVRIADSSGSLTLRFFYFSNSQREALQRGSRVRCHGEVRRGPIGLEMVHPEYRVLREPVEPLPQVLTPIYPITEGLTQGRLRQLVRQAFATLSQRPLPDLLPPDTLPADVSMSLLEALKFLHQPPVGTDLSTLAEGHHPAQRRLAFEELLAHQLSLQELRRQTRRELAPALHDAQGLQQRLIASLPFALTGAQQRVRTEIDADLGGERPMSRLIQGDVGSGKTAVAALAAGSPAVPTRVSRRRPAHRRRYPDSARTAPDNRRHT